MYSGRRAPLVRRAFSIEVRAFTPKWPELLPRVVGPRNVMLLLYLGIKGEV
jgi:hypothetical protein